MPGFDNGVVYATNVDFSQTSEISGNAQVLLNGQLLIGSTAQPNIKVGRLTSVGGTVTITNGSGTIDLSAVPGTQSGLLSHAVVIAQGNAPFVASNVGTDGQVLIAGTGLDPAFASITAGTNITLTPGSRSLTIAASSTPLITNRTLVTTTPYVVLSTDYYLSVNTSTAKTIQLPNAPTTGTVYIIKDFSGTSAANNITITTVGGAVLIDGATSLTINQNYGAASILWNSASFEVF